MEKLCDSKTMIVLDLDKTLLNSKHEISEATLEVLRKYHKSGGKIAIATGRAITRSLQYAKQIQACGLIALNGSVTYVKETIIDQRPIDKKKVYDLVQRLMQIEDMSMAVAYPDYMITSNPKFAVKGVNDYCDMKSFNLDEIQNIKAFSNRYDELDQIDFGAYGCRKTTSITEPDFHVISQKDVDKFTGIQALSEYFQIPVSHMIAFGDDYNDLQMLKKCGIGVAMANASDMVKDAADDITLSNEEDGVGYWLNGYFHLEDEA